jgi:precorrin-6B methylase 2
MLPEVNALLYLNGFVKNTVSLVKPVWIQANELALGIHTELRDEQAQKEAPWRRDGSGAGAKYADNLSYSSIDYWNVRSIIRVLNPGPDDVFYDIGSGMGRIVCVMARRHLRKCVGIELHDPLCQIARTNATKLRGRHTLIEIICSDVTRADLSDGTLFFMFNPFGEKTMHDMLENIARSLNKNPRTLKIAYCNPKCEATFRDSGWLEKIHQIRLVGGHDVAFWQSIDDPRIKR